MHYASCATTEITNKPVYMNMNIGAKLTIIIIVVNESVVMLIVIMLTCDVCISFVIDVCCVESIYMITVTVVDRSTAAFLQTCIHTYTHGCIIISESKVVCGLTYMDNASIN